MYIKKRIILMFTSIIVLIFSGAGVYAATMEASITKTIYACQMKDVGLLRVVDANTVCKKNETKISWNVVGPKGDKGDKGVQGPKGDTGIAGATGVTGPTGPQGLAGKDGTVGPQGPEGPQGPAGPLGPSGKDGAAGPAGAPGAAGPQGPKGDSGRKVVGGYIRSDGTKREGTGYTVSKITTGEYLIMFPVETFKGPPVMTITPAYVNADLVVDTPQAHILGHGPLPDGRTPFFIKFTKPEPNNATEVDTPFWFIAAEVE